MPEAFDAAIANAGTGGAAFAGDSFADADANTRFMPLTVLAVPDGLGYDRVTGTAGLPVVAQTGATFPVSAASLPLPTGASTAAKQPALGTAGAASSDVITVQGVTSMTALKVDGSGVTQPVSGTVTANVGTGTMTVAGTVTADAGTGTFAVSAASLPLPSGAATSAKQPLLGTAGTAASDVLTVQGIASMTALKVDGSAVTQPVSGTVTANAGSGTMAVSAASLPLPTGASTSAKQAAFAIAGSPSDDLLSVQGHASMTALKVDGSAVTQPVSGTVTANAGTGTFDVSATALPLPTGASTAAKQPALGVAGTPSADLISVQGHAGMTPLVVDGSAATQPVSIAGTVATSAVSWPLPTGAATSAKQPALGSAGSAATDVLTVQGISSMTALLVDGSAHTQPVSGTITANAGTGTMAVSAAALPLPTGAATEAKQPAIGSAGSPAADVISVQGHSGMTALLVDGSATTQPVSGTIIANAGSGTFAVSAASLPLPSGASTAAKQPSLGTAGVAASDVVTVQGIGSMTPLVVSGTVTANAGIGTLAISAASLPLPTGAATDAKLPAFGIAGTASADVISVQGRSGMTALTVAEGGAALTSLQLIDDAVFAEDVASAGGDKGIQILAKRGDTPAATSGTDGDYEPLQVSGGLLWTRGRGMQDSGGTDITDTANHALKVNVVAGSTSGTQYTEDAASASDPIGNSIIAIRDDARVGNLTSADGDNVALRGTNFGELYVKHVDSVPITAAALPLPAGAATAAKQPGFGSPGSATANVTTVQGVASMTPLLVTVTGFAEDQASADGDGGMGVLAIRQASPANTSNADGDYEFLKINGGRLWCSAIIDTALPAGSNAIGNITTLTTLTGSGVAHDAADAGNPHKIGGKAATTNPTAVSDGDRTDARFDKIGRMNVRQGQVRELVTDGGTITLTTTAETTILAAGGAGVFHDLTLVLVSNTSAAAVRVDFRDATAGTIRFPVYVPAGQMVGFAPPRPVKQATANNNWTAQSSAGLTDIRVFVQADKEV